MNVTEVRVTRLNKPESNLKAYASVCFDGVLVVDGYRVVQGPDAELAVYMPRKIKTAEDGTITRRNISYALDPALRETIVQAVKDKYLEE